MTIVIIKSKISSTPNACTNTFNGQEHQEEAEIEQHIPQTAQNVDRVRVEVPRWDDLPPMSSPEPGTQVGTPPIHENRRQDTSSQPLTPLTVGQPRLWLHSVEVEM